MSINFDLLLLKYLIALAISLPIYYLLPRRAQNFWVLLISYGFLATWTWYYAVALLILTLINYMLGQEIQTTREKAHSRALVWLGIILNVGVLAFLRQPRFFVRSMPDSLAVTLTRGFSILDLNAWPVDLDELMPLGMSFVVLQAIAYLVDIRRGQIDANVHLADFALYLVYFPKIVAGPIERAQLFLPKLANQRIVDNERLGQSLTLIMIGLFRKLVIATPLQTMIPANFYTEPSSFPVPAMLGWLVAFGLMLYNDFAGYSSMARGISGLFGIELSRNFAIPYLSRNINEFWNRWHISLSHWLRDYIFFPINRALRKRIPNRRHLLNLVIPAMGTMLVSGLWHQTSLHMLLWGGLHGIFLIGAQLISRWRHMPPSDQQPLLRQFATGLVVLALVMMAWVPFGMNFTATLDFGQALLRWGHEGAPDVRILILLLPAILLDWIQHRTQDEVVFMRWPPLAQASIATVALLALFLVLRAEMTLEGFVYQGF